MDDARAMMAVNNNQAYRDSLLSETLQDRGLSNSHHSRLKMFSTLSITVRREAKAAARVTLGARAFSVTPDAAAGGSSYENYSETSKTYDNFRAPIGLDILRKALADNAALRGMKVIEIGLLGTHIRTHTHPPPSTHTLVLTRI